MKPGDRIYWLRSDRVLGSRSRHRIPAIYLGINGKDREKAFVYVLEDGEVKRRTAMLHNLMARNEDKEIDVAAAGRSHYTGPVPTQPQISALAWLKSNGGLEVPNMNMHGKAKEWPVRATLLGLLERGLINFEQEEFSWKAEINAMGESVLRDHTL